MTRRRASAGRVREADLDATSLVRLRPRAKTIHISRARSVLATNLDGWIAPAGGEFGFFVRETRLISCYRWTIDGEAPEPVALSNVEQHSWLGYYIAPVPGSDTGPPDEGSGHVPPSTTNTLELRLTRSVADVVHEDVDLRNFSNADSRFVLALEIDGDFADYGEVAGSRKQRGRLDRRWDAASRSITLGYAAEREDHEHPGRVLRFERGARIAIRSDVAPRVDGARLLFDVRLPRRGSWHACVEIVPLDPAVAAAQVPGCYCLANEGAYGARSASFIKGSTDFGVPDRSLPVRVVSVLERARRDLSALRLFDLDEGRSWTMAAGLPIYVALFGRDTLTAAWEAALVGPEMMEGTLPALARLQGAAHDDWRDEQPGRMIHEVHDGPLSVMNLIPQGRYYGSVTTSGFFAVVLSELWHWTGDRAQVEPLIAPAVRALESLDRYNADESGFFRYHSRSEKGVRHQGWKDSGDAIVDADGEQVDPPIATCEEQAFIYAAKLQLAEVLWSFGNRSEARRLFTAARELKARFNEHFWCDDLGTFALGRGPDGRPIRSIASNAGHCLAAGIADRALVRRAADRLLRDDMFSGWGIRTLSAENPAYNPFSYHRGSVWPVEQGTFVLGFVRHGLHAQALRLARAIFDAAALFEHLRLPELFSGHPRDAQHPFPALYPSANSPQAWSASTVFLTLQAILGLYPYAPLQLLVVDPHLPSWLPEIELRNLRVGRATVTCRFRRDRDGRTAFDVRDLRGTLRVVRQPSPWSLTATAGERIWDLLASLRTL